MKILTQALVCATAAAALLAGCAKPPTQEMTAAQGAVQATVGAGAETYAAKELAAVKDQLAQADAELKVQEGKLLKNYDKAKEMLAKAKADAEAAAALVPARKEAARSAAATAETEARTALDEAKALLAQAPKGKGSQADLEAFQADLKGIEDALAEVPTLMAAEGYADATAKAQSLREKAAGVSEQVTNAMAKVKP